jgi:hypothetical protein
MRVNISCTYKRTRACINLFVRVVVYIQQRVRAAVRVCVRACVPQSVCVCAQCHVCGMRTAVCVRALNGRECVL